MVDRQKVLERRRSPLHRIADELAAGSGSAVTLKEIPFFGQIGVRAVPGSATADVLAKGLGASLPSQAGQVTSLGDRGHALWLGPDEFLVILPDEADGGPEPASLAASLTQSLGSLPGQVVDLSANRTTLELRGAAAQQVLDKSCRLDLDEVAFPVGTAAATLLGAVGVILWRVEADTWRVMPRSSFAVHVARWLLDGMREYV
ncbi:sarcosine oxidase subunit gamma [Yimella sp. cx-573]|nr:sarcosine oxidase subunit gamma [Yimella sp. cx-573]